MLVVVLISVFTINVTSSNVSAITKQKKTTHSKSLANKKAKQTKVASKKLKKTKHVKKTQKKVKKTKLAKKTSKRTARKKHSKKLTASSLKRRVAARGSGRALGVGNVMKVIEYAKKYLGVNYRFGRSSSSAFDCSGFTMFIYKAVGIHLPHSAAGQANLGIAVDKKHLRPGDLVFFETYKPGISHVGMYIGNGHFIHASSGKGEVTITKLSDAYYVQRYRGSTRIIND